jgi:hypothetical protein
MIEKLEDEEILKFLETPKYAYEIVVKFGPKISERSLYYRLESLKKRGEIKKLWGGRWVVSSYKEQIPMNTERKICPLYNSEVTLLLRKIYYTIDFIKKSELKTIVEIIRGLRIGLFDGGILYSDKEVESFDKNFKLLVSEGTKTTRDHMVDETTQDKIEIEENIQELIDKYEDEQIELEELIDKYEDEQIELEELIDKYELFY